MGEPAKNAAQNPVPPFSLFFGDSDSTITRSHSTPCELLTIGVPSSGQLAFRHLFAQQ